MTKQHEGLPVAGYKPQDALAVSLVNKNKAAEETVLRILDDLEGVQNVDRRWLAIGRTAIEQGFMAVNRAVFKPGRVKLPDDDKIVFLFRHYPQVTLTLPATPITWREAVERAAAAMKNGRLITKVECVIWWIADQEDISIDDVIPAGHGPRRFHVVFNTDEEDAAYGS